MTRRLINERMYAELVVDAESCLHDYVEALHCTDGTVVKRSESGATYRWASQAAFAEDYEFHESEKFVRFRSFPCAAVTAHDDLGAQLRCDANDASSIDQALREALRRPDRLIELFVMMTGVVGELVRRSGNQREWDVQTHPMFAGSSLQGHWPYVVGSDGFRYPAWDTPYELMFAITETPDPDSFRGAFADQPFSLLLDLTRLHAEFESTPRP